MGEYWLKLGCLCLTSFFLVHLAVGLVVMCLSPAAVRMAGQVQPRRAARLLFALRMLPMGCAGFVVGVICIPSYLQFEKNPAVGEIGVVCFGFTILGFSVWTASILRGVCAAIHSFTFAKRCKPRGFLGGSATRSVSTYFFDYEDIDVALVGVIWPRLVVSQRVLDTLSAGQMKAVLSHEHAHRTSRDNLKRLFLLLLPGLLPGVAGLDSLEKSWAKFAEWAADDDACAGNPFRSVELAEALVHVARLHGQGRPPALASCLTAGEVELSTRIGRLLQAPPTDAKRGRDRMLLFWGISIAMATVSAFILVHPSMLYTAHRAIELIVRDSVR